MSEEKMRANLALQQHMDCVCNPIDCQFCDERTKKYFLDIQYQQSKRRVELMKKRLQQGLTLTEAHELATLEVHDLVPWKLCEQHNMKFVYASKCPNCLD